MSEVSYTILLDIDRDIENWYEGCNKQSYGLDWKQRVPADVYEHVAGKGRDEAERFLKEYLTRLYTDDAAEIASYKEHLSQVFSEKFAQACKKLEEITGKSFCKSHITVYLTTFPRAPYNYEEGSYYVAIGWGNAIRNFMHEALHFQFIHYWQKSPASPVSALPSAQFHILKEALTVVLDEDLLPLIESVDTGYASHAALRAKLRTQWQETKDFDTLVTYGLGILPKYSS